MTKGRDEVRKASKGASETRDQTLHAQARTEPNTFSLRRGFCTSVLFINSAVGTEYEQFTDSTIFKRAIANKLACRL